MTTQRQGMRIRKLDCPSYGEPLGLPANEGVVCRKCGACCVAPDITALNKPLGVPCRFLGRGEECTIYPQRPDICRRYLPDELCGLIAAPTLDQRVANYLQLFDLQCD